MGTIDEEAASKFINALVKSVQTLCHGYLDFNSGIEIIGHINLSVDKVGSLDYILKEKVCKNNENSTLFISNSFHAQPKSEQTAKAKNSQSEAVLQRRQSSDNESGRVSSAISSISSALSSAKESSANSTGSRPQQNTAKRKAHDDLNNDHRPAKSVSRDSHHFLSSHSQPSPHDIRSSSPIDSKPAISGVSAGFDSSPRTSSADGSATMLPQTANVTSDNQSELDVNLEGSVLERVDDQSNSEMQERDDSDLDLEVTFIKEEFVEGERSACEFQGSGGGQQYGRTSHQRASTSSDGMGEQPLFPVALHSSASATYVPGSQDMVSLAQHYAGSHGSSTSQPQPGPSGMRDPADVSGYEISRGRYSGMRVEYAKYKILEKADPLPDGYQRLVEGSKVAVPSKWLQTLLSQCRSRNPSFILTMLANGLVRPWEVVHGGTSAYTGTYLEPVITALKLYGVMHLNFTMSQATRVLNIKLCTERRTRKRQFERAMEERDAEFRQKTMDMAPATTNNP